AQADLVAFDVVALEIAAPIADLVLCAAFVRDRVAVVADVLPIEAGAARGRRRDVDRRVARRLVAGCVERGRGEVQAVAERDRITVGAYLDEVDIADVARDARLELRP